MMSSIGYFQQQWQMICKQRRGIQGGSALSDILNMLTKLSATICQQPSCLGTYVTNQAWWTLLNSVITRRHLKSPQTPAEWEIPNTRTKWAGEGLCQKVHNLQSDSEYWTCSVWNDYDDYCYDNVAFSPFFHSITHHVYMYQRTRKRRGYHYERYYLCVLERE